MSNRLVAILIELQASLHVALLFHPQVSRQEPGHQLVTHDHKSDIVRRDVRRDARQDDRSMCEDAVRNNLAETKDRRAKIPRESH